MIFVLNKDKTAIVSIDDQEAFTVFLTGDGRKIQVKSSKTSACEMLGSYSTSDQTKMALGMLFAALSAGDKAFEFPDENDLTFAQQRRSETSTRHNRHGGS